VFSAAIASDEKTLHAWPQRVRTLLLHCLLKKIHENNNLSPRQQNKEKKLRSANKSHKRQEKRDVMRKIASSLFAVGGGSIRRHSTTKTRDQSYSTPVTANFYNLYYYIKN